MGEERAEKPHQLHTQHGDLAAIGFEGAFAFVGTLRIPAADRERSPSERSARADAVLLLRHVLGEAGTVDRHVADEQRLGWVTNQGPGGLLFAVRVYQSPIVKLERILGLPAARKEEVGIEGRANDLDLRVLKVDAELLLLIRIIRPLVGPTGLGANREQAEVKSRTASPTPGAPRCFYRRVEFKVLEPGPTR